MCAPYVCPPRVLGCDMCGMHACANAPMGSRQGPKCAHVYGQRFACVHTCDGICQNVDVSEVIMTNESSSSSASCLGPYMGLLRGSGLGHGLGCHHSPSPYITHHHSSSLTLTLHHSPSLFITHHHSPSLYITHHHSPSLAITRHHSSSLVNTFYHSPSLFITNCITHCHSSIFIIRRHSSSLFSTLQHSPSIFITHHHSASLTIITLHYSP